MVLTVTGPVGGGTSQRVRRATTRLAVRSPSRRSRPPTWTARPSRRLRRTSGSKIPLYGQKQTPYLFLVGIVTGWSYEENSRSAGLVGSACDAGGAGACPGLSAESKTDQHQPVSGQPGRHHHRLRGTGG